MVAREAMKEDQTTEKMVMDGEAIHKAIRRIAHEIIERNSDLANLLIVGIPTRGVEEIGRAHV